MHLLVGDLDKASSYLIERVGTSRGTTRDVDLLGEGLELAETGLDVERLVSVLSKDVGEQRRDEVTEDSVGVRDGQLSSLSVAGRSGVGANRLWADYKDAVLVEQLGASSSGDGLDGQLRAGDLDAGGECLVDEVEGAGESRDVRARSTLQTRKKKRWSAMNC